MQHRASRMQNSVICVIWTSSAVHGKRTAAKPQAAKPPSKVAREPRDKDVAKDAPKSAAGEHILVAPTGCSLCSRCIDAT